MKLKQHKSFKASTAFSTLLISTQNLPCCLPSAHTLTAGWPCRLSMFSNRMRAARLRATTLLIGWPVGFWWPATTVNFIPESLL